MEKVTQKHKVNEFILNSIDEFDKDKIISNSNSNSLLSDLVSKKIIGIDGLFKDSDEVIFSMDDGNKYMLYHEQDCCESVWLDDFEGFKDDLIGGVVYSAEEVKYDGGCRDYSSTWTFYKIETSKGGLWMRWNGVSNGYYSEAVNFKKL